MSATPSRATEQLPATFARARFYYGWVMLLVAAAAMVGTLPGRTQGLGLITEALLADLQLDRVAYAQMNLWATLLGALSCIGIGRLIDRAGSRGVLAVNAALLAAVVFAMTAAHGTTGLFLALLASRALGQSALSVVSLTLVGQWFRRRLHLAMGLYSVALSIGFMAAFPLIGALVKNSGWRVAWSAVGAGLVVLVVLALWLVRRGPAACGLAGDPAAPGPADAADAAPESGATLGAALRTPAFWVFALASSTYNLVASGIGLFNESILAERGFAAGTYYRSLVTVALLSLVGNFLGGWLSSRWPVNRLMALTMALLAAALVSLPALRTLPQVDAFSVVMGLAGGFVIVIFFSFWAKAFGRAHLGRITGAAQMLTVLASAVGPLLLAQCHAVTGSYAAVFYTLAAAVAMLALAAWVVRVPVADEAR